MYPVRVDRCCLLIDDEWNLDFVAKEDVGCLWATRLVMLLDVIHDAVQIKAVAGGATGRVWRSKKKSCNVCLPHNHDNPQSLSVGSHDKPSVRDTD